MSRGSGPRTRAPPTSTVPPEGASRPPIMFRSVLFPQPLGPIRASSSPRATSIVVSASARTCRASPGSPNWCATRETRIAVCSVPIVLLRQERLRVERAHVGLLVEDLQLDVVLAQDGERLRVELSR